MGIFSELGDTIEVYTGISPAAFFTVLALLFVVYIGMWSMFSGPRQYDYGRMDDTDLDFEFSLSSEPETALLGDVTEETLRAYDGTDPGKPLLMAINGQVYDVSQSRMLYGPSGPYAMFAGRDASRALALLSLDEKDFTGNLEGLTESELEGLRDWEQRFKEKFARVGQIVKPESAGQ